MGSHNKICRACLNTKESFTYLLYHNVSYEMYWFCTSVEVDPNDELPKYICDGCFNLLVKFCNFRQTCIQSNNTLTSLYLNKLLEYQSKQEIIDTESDAKESVKLSDAAKLESQVAKQELHEDGSTDNDYYDETNINEEADVKLENGFVTKNCGSTRVKGKIERKFLSCEICDKRFVNADRFEAHKGTHEGKPMIIQCNVCQKIFKKWQSLARHKVDHHMVTSLEQLRCSTCGKLYSTQMSLRQHQALHLRTQQWMCDICGKEFKAQKTLKDHQQTHEENRLRTHECELCGRKFFTRDALGSHRNKVHKDRKFICDICSTPFREKCTLVRHIQNKHEGQRPYKCKLCSKSFATNTGRTDHTRYHSGERPYPCSYCTKKFITRQTKRDHEKIHTGEKPFKCKLCTQAFPQKGTLNRHMKVHEKHLINGVKVSM